MCRGACSPKKFLYFQTVLDCFWWYFDLYFTYCTEYQFCRTRWFQLLCRHRRYATHENATPLYLPRPRNERAPHYRYICARSVYIYIGTSVTRFVYNVQRPNAIFLLRNLVLAMVCVKKNFPLVYSSLRRAHTTVTRSRQSDRHHGYKHDRLQGIFNYRLLPRKVVR